MKNTRACGRTQTQLREGLQESWDECPAEIRQSLSLVKPPTPENDAAWTAWLQSLATEKKRLRQKLVSHYHKTKEAEIEARVEARCQAFSTGSIKTVINSALERGVAYLFKRKKTLLFNNRT